MKLKSYVLLAASGLLAASCAYLAPVYADDLTNTSAPSTAPADNSGMQNPSDPGDNSAMTNPPADNSPDANVGASDPAPSSDPSPSNDMTNNPSGADMNNNSGNNDDSTPDTATGDDDY